MQEENTQSPDQELSLVDTLRDIVLSSIADSPLPETNLTKEQHDNILLVLILDIVESLGKLETEREFVLTSTVIAQVYLNVLQEILIKNLKGEVQ